MTQSPMDATDPITTPPCPITGAPAVRHIQWVPARLLIQLWRAGMGLEAGPSFAGQERFGLWLSPTGLHFFDPMIEGDRAFYARFYTTALRRQLWGPDCIRRDFEIAARSITAGARVLEVGCGFAEFRRLIPKARYTGLDSYFMAGGVADVRNETLHAHLAEHGGSYDAVCAFQVLERLAQPAAAFADMVRAARPGGLLIVGVPHVPSAQTRIPNNMLMAPPYRQSWWTRAALTVLAERHGASVMRIDNVPWGSCDALFYWMERCSPICCAAVHYDGALSWRAAAFAARTGGRLLHAWRKTAPPGDEGVGLLMVARRGR
jgi:SAM-dependent methyltransferase